MQELKKEKKAKTILSFFNNILFFFLNLILKKNLIINLIGIFKKKINSSFSE